MLEAKGKTNNTRRKRKKTQDQGRVGKCRTDVRTKTDKYIGKYSREGKLIRDR